MTTGKRIKRNQVAWKRVGRSIEIEDTGMATSKIWNGMREWNAGMMMDF